MYKSAIAAATPENLTCSIYKLALPKAAFSLMKNLNHLVGNNSITG